MAHTILHNTRYDVRHGPKHNGALTLTDSVPGIPQDGPDNWYLPATPQHFIDLGLPAPNGGLWLCNELAGNLIDQSGNALDLVQGGAVPTYGQAVAGWTATGVAMAEGSTSRFSVAAGVGPNPAQAGGTSVAWLWYMDITACTATRQNFFATATGGGSFFCRTTVTPRMQAVSSFATQTSASVDPVTPGVIACLMTINHTAGRARIYTSLEEFTGGTLYGAFVDGIKGVGGSGGATAAQTVIRGAHWHGADAETIDTKATLTALGIALPY